ncbi:MAG: helix-turn-helix transcriptional regulator [Chitinophagaceae bacterium]
MNSPQKRNSKILDELRDSKSRFETARTKTSMFIAATILKTILEKGMSKIEFAAAMDKKPSVISKWLSGTHNFTSDTLSDIQLVLGINLMNVDKAEIKSQIIISVPANATLNIFEKIENLSEFVAAGVGASISFEITKNFQIFDTSLCIDDN